MVTSNYLMQQGLMEVVVENDEYFLTEIPELIGSETESTRRSRKSRQLKKLQCNTNTTLIEQNCNTEIEIDIEKEKEIDIELEKKREGEIKENPQSNYNFYGEFNNVKLSDEEYGKLENNLRNNLNTMIEKLLRYLVNSNKTYSNHYATILSWYEQDKDKLPKKKISIEDYYKTDYGL